MATVSQFEATDTIRANMPESKNDRVRRTTIEVRRLQTTGLMLFLFIPVVLFLFVRRPEPLGLSLVGGIALMLGHRRLARPYMERSRTRKCLWSNRGFDDHEAGVPLVLDALSGAVEARCHVEHRHAAAGFFTFLDRWRWPLRLGIFVPLLALLGTSGAVVAGYDGPLEQVTALFQLIIGLTVQVVALGYRFETPGQRPTVPFPVHNFFLLGVRNLLWVFRLVGAWWIFVGIRYFVG